MNQFVRFYFLGIGGIGMSAIARYYNSRGFAVAGYDRTETKLTKDMVVEGMSVSYDENVNAIPEEYLEKKKTLVVLTPAVPANHPQLVYFRNEGFTVMKRAEVLGYLTSQNKGICVAGTHGKTTTSTITAHLLYQSKVTCNAFLGGISNNYKTNLLLSKESNLVVIEADEYDRSFHHLRPYMAVITSDDADHLDIYGSHEAVRESFEHFASLVKPGGVLIAKKGIEIHPTLQKGVKLMTYSMDQGGDFHAENIIIKSNEIIFDFITPTEAIRQVKLNVPAKINVENSVAAMALAWLNGVTSEELRVGISSFSGIYRRFNVVYRSENVVYIDDYAHHPSELKAGIESIREMYPGRKLTVVFQPHLYSRTRDFAADFAKILSLPDRLILLDIYPARELPIEGVSSQMILDKVTLADKRICSKQELVEIMENDKTMEVVVTFGAGDIDTLVPVIKEKLKLNYNGKTIVA